MLFSSEVHLTVSVCVERTCIDVVYFEENEFGHNDSLQ